MVTVIFSTLFLQCLIKFNKHGDGSNWNTLQNTPLLRILIGPLPTLRQRSPMTSQGRGEVSAITIYILPGESRDSRGGDPPSIMDLSHCAPPPQSLPRHIASPSRADSQWDLFVCSVPLQVAIPVNDTDPRAHPIAPFAKGNRKMFCVCQDFFNKDLKGAGPTLQLGLSVAY
jgi:hypothetical protein